MTGLRAAKAPAVSRSAREVPPKSLPIAILLALDHAVLVWVGVDLAVPGRLPLLAVDSMLGLLAFAVLLLLGHRPLLCAATTSALTAVSTTAVGPSAVAFYALARRRSVAQVVPLIVLSTLAAALFELWFPVRGVLSPAGTAALVAMAYVLVALWGARSGRTAEALALQRSRLTMLEAVQDRRAEDARRRDHRQMAAYLHDEFGHRLSLLVLASDDVTRSARAGRAVTEEEAERLHTGVQRTIAAYRSTLDDLAPSGSSSARVRWADVTDFCDEIRTRLPAVSVSDTVSVPPPHGLCALCLALLRESFTNAVKYATGAPIAVTLSGGPAQGLRIRVANEAGDSHRGLAGAGHGSGLNEMRRRVDAMGGSFEAAPTVDEGFVIDASLPWPAAADDGVGDGPRRPTPHEAADERGVRGG